MTLNIKSAAELTNVSETYLIYGNPGTGKTTAIKYLPGKKLVIDIDKSSIVLKGEKNIDIVEVDTYKIWESWMDIVDYLLNTKTDYDVIVVDNVTELLRSILTQLGREGRNNRVPEMAHYQRVDFVIMDSFRAIKNIGKTVVFTAWETSDEWTTAGGQVFNRAIPDIRKTILNNFLGLCDVVGRLIVTTNEEGEAKRGFILQPAPDVYAKNRLDNRRGCLQHELIIGGDAAEKTKTIPAGPSKQD